MNPNGTTNVTCRLKRRDAVVILQMSNTCGPVAQLGARFHGMEEVVGSNPTRSTKSGQTSESGSTGSTPNPGDPVPNFLSVNRLYAGLEFGSYRWAYTDVDLLKALLDVSFHSMQLHPLRCNYGMGDTGSALGKLNPAWMTSPKRRKYVDQFLSTTIGCGNMGWLVDEFTDAPFPAE